MTLGAALRGAMGRAGIGAKTLSKLTGLPRTTIDNWLEGTVSRPRHWRSLLQIARVLSLPADEVDGLLAAARYPPLAVLARDLPPTDPDRTHLRPWPIVLDEPARHQVRAPAGDFVGRAEAIARLTAALSGSGVAGIGGMAGIGKTELAILVANMVRDTFPDAQLLVNMRGVSAHPLDPTQALRQVIHAFAPNVPVDGDVAQLEPRYRSVLSGQRVLVIADDARDAAQVRPLLPPVGCALLVTTRQRFTLPGMSTVHLDQLAEDDAITLVQGICDRLDASDARALATACGGLPLALRASAGLLHNDPALVVAELLAELADGRRRLARLRDPDDPELDLVSSLGSSYARLDEPARAIFRQLGVLACDFTAELAIGLVPAPPQRDVAGTLHLLVTRNLLGYDARRARFRLHDLVRDLARAHLEAAGDLTTTTWRYAETAVALAARTKEQYLAGGDGHRAALATFDADRPHLDAARRWAAQHAGTEPGDRLLVADAVAADAIGFLRYDMRREIMPQALAALAAARRLAAYPEQMVILNRLGRVHLGAGDLDRAVLYFEEQLALAGPHGGPADEASALHGLCVAYELLGNPRRAIAFGERNLALTYQTGDVPRRAISLCALGRAHLGLGDPDRALPYLEQGYAIACDLTDPQRQAVLASNLAVAYLDRGDAARAADTSRRALDIVRQLGDRYGEAAVLSDLARATAALGEPEQALGYADDALTAAREIGARHHEALALRAVAESHAAAGDVALARAAFEEAIEVWRTVGDQQGLAECSWLLGRLLAETEPERALSLLRTALAYERDVGHARAGEHAEVLARLEAAEFSRLTG